MKKADAPQAEEPASHQLRCDAISANYLQLAETGIPKHLRIRNAILATINDGTLGPGDQVPPEQNLSAAMRVSLGTVQRALGALGAEGTLIRQHGRGTFVAEPRRPVDELWQMRFLRKDGDGFLPVYSRVVDRRKVVERGPWQDILGVDTKGYLKISRIFNVDDKFECYSWFIVQAGRFGAMQRSKDRSEQSINLRRILGEEFGAPTASVTQHANIAEFASDICDRLSLAHGSVGLMVDAVGHGHGGRPNFFHRIWIPKNDYRLDMTQDPPRERN